MDALSNVEPPRPNPIIQFLGRHFWWIGPLVVIMPLVYFSGNAGVPSAAYFGTAGIWNLLSKLSET